MPRIPVRSLDTAPEQTRPALEKLQKKMGKLLNIHAEMAHAPVVLAAYTDMQDAIATHGSFDARIREAIALLRPSGLPSTVDRAYCSYQPERPIAWRL